MRYSVQERLKPRALTGISDEQITQHWELYKAYVTNVNDLLAEMGKLEVGALARSELKRRLEFESNGMVLHEYYFDNLAAGAKLSPQSRLAEHLTNVWGSTGVWQDDFTATAAIRGDGWVILYRDPQADRLFNWWVADRLFNRCVGDHEVNHFVGLHPVLVLDVWEHAWRLDFGARGRGKYIKAFLENVNWPVVEQRFNDSRETRAGRSVARPEARGLG